MFHTLYHTSISYVEFYSFNDLDTIIHAFVSLRIDYCSSLCIGNLYKEEREIIIAVLASLHWLSLKPRIQFKVILMGFFLSVAWHFPKIYC